MTRRASMVKAAITLVAMAFTLLLMPQAQAASLNGGTAAGPTERVSLSLTASPVKHLNPKGQVVTVTGSGYDPTVGIYVALCVTPKNGEPPSPCGGGINTSGKNPTSMWISSNPPPYGAKLAVPYKKNGSFKVKIKVSALIGKIDCRKVSCSIVTRADHLNTDDRRFDVIIPVKFNKR